eukprot:2530242-Karenia_brevis.AAC.1
MSRASSIASSRGSSAFMPSTIGSEDGFPHSHQHNGRDDQFAAPATPKHGALGYDDLNQSRASMGNASTASGDTVSKSYLDNALAIFQQQVTSSLQSACSSLVKNSYEAIAGQ